MASQGRTTRQMVRVAKMAYLPAFRRRRERRTLRDGFGGGKEKEVLQTPHLWARSETGHGGPGCQRPAPTQEARRGDAPSSSAN